MIVPAGLHPAGGAGQHHVGHARGAGHSDVLDHEKVQPFKQTLDAVRIGVGLDRVFADDVQAAQLAVLHRVHHRRLVLAGHRWNLDAPQCSTR